MTAGLGRTAAIDGSPGQSGGDPCGQLSDRQKACLRLVAERYQVKEIANALDITPAAVVERLRSARTTLGVSTSRDAARLLTESEARPAYISYVDMPPALAEPAGEGSLGSSGYGSPPTMLQEAQAPFRVSGDARPRPKEPAPDALWRAFDRLTFRHHIAIAAVAVFLLLAILIGAAAMLDTATRLHRDFRAGAQSSGTPAH